MLDDFFTRALVAGIGVAIVCGPLGCFVVWRRIAYFGDTLAHSALLGIALAYLMELEPVFIVFGVSTIVALSLIALRKRSGIGSDAMLGLLAHSSLALGLVVLSFLTWVRFDLSSLLFGDILSVTRGDILLIYTGGAVILGGLIWIWRPLFAATVNRDLAEAEGARADRMELILMLLLTLTLAIAIKVVGVLLITALLIVPAAAARRFSHGPEQMAVLAALFGILSVVGGLTASLEWDTPSGPSIVVAALTLFLIGLIRPGRRGTVVGGERR